MGTFETIPVLVLTQARMPEALLESLRAVSPRLQVTHRIAQTIEEVGDVWAEVEVLYTTFLLPAAEQAPRLRWVQGHYAGVEHFLQPPSPLLDQVIFTTASGIHAPVMAEYVLMMMLAFDHHLPRMCHYQASGTWPSDRWNQFAPRELRGTTVGIVGYGSVGREVARLARAFGMRVLATKREPARLDDPGWRVPGTGDPTGEQVARFYSPRNLRAMVSECEYVVLTVPLTPETRGLIDADVLHAMKPEAVLINVARGAVVDEVALVEALEAGVIGGAVLDVYAQEPLPSDSPLWQIPNAILSPHVAGFTLHYDERAMALFAENLRRYVAGEPLLNAVDLKLGY